MTSLLPSRPRLRRSDAMRLINVETMQLHYLPNADIVEIEYATLSHTWGQDETTYQKWHDAQARESDDTKKVRDACKVVKESLGLQWLWVDTCCINKADEDEVNEAVNSNFLWYQSSRVCLAYLSDVPTANTNDNELLSFQFRHSRWFTRGWTLSELLAPPQLVLYAADWTVLGRRDDSLADLISLIVGIDQAYLSGRKNVQQASFGTRMSWISGRRTARVEDMAYCMLGILDIEMSIQYGEREKAMSRLEERIKQKVAAGTGSPSSAASGRAGRRRADIELEEEAPSTKDIIKVIGDKGRNIEYVDNSLSENSLNPLWIWILDPHDDNAGSLKRLLDEMATTHAVIKDAGSLNLEYQKVPLIFYRERAPFPKHRLARERIISSGYSLWTSATLVKLQESRFSKAESSQLQKVFSPTSKWRYEVFFDPSNIIALALLKLKLKELPANHDDSIVRFELEFHFKLPDLSEVKRLIKSIPGLEERGLPLPPASKDSDEGLSAFEYDVSAQSGGTRPSTVPTTIPSALPHTSGALPGTDPVTGEEYQHLLECLDNSNDQLDLKRQHAGEHEEPDTVTIYSIETLADDPKLHYFQAFVDQLAEDVKTGAEGMVLRDLGSDYLGHALKEFSWKLHEESSNPFQLETSVIIHRKRRNIVDVLDFEVPQFDILQFEISESGSEQSSAKSGVGDDGFPTEVPFRKTEETIVAWIGEVNPEPGSTTDLSQMPQYRQFIQESSAYRWLLTKLKQHNRLTCEKPNIMDEIGVAIRNKLRTTESLRKMSRNRAPAPIKMTYTVDWDLLGFMRNRSIPSPFSAALPDILCLTGTWDEAQATTVIEYMDQTWPQSGRALIALLQTLLSALEEEDETGARSEHTFNLGNLEVKSNRQSLDITVTGGQYLISEVGEQIAWLVSALQAVPGSPEGFVMSFPGITDLVVHSPSRKGKKVGNLRASCAFRIDWKQPIGKGVPVGLCWKQLFCLPVLVCGYPILRRSVPKSGLEISLPLAASIVGSDQLVQLDDRLMIKGFNMLMIATLVAADIMVWHLFVSEKEGQRISYMDSRLDGIDAMTFEAVSLHHIAGKRHIVGWCAKATDWCGSSSTNHSIRPAGLPRSPSSLKIDKLYIEGGATVIGGFMMDINKKEQPFWLQREKDYPDLLNWVKLRPVVFYDVEERRAWLVDGASALLHLVRMSLHQDTNDIESAYDWVYDSSKLKDNWPGLGSRQAAVNTLKNWDNRALGLHIIGKHADANGVLVPEYSTFEDRVKRIIHSIEILIDQQEKAASQDGFKFSQTLDPRRDVIGFEVMDIISPSGPIYSRVQRINSWGHGWTDLVPSIGITTIFGRGFGDLIRADEPGELCPNWRLVPSGKDFLAPSVSTIQMLYEKRLLTLEPGRSEDEITKRFTIVAAKETSNPCNCLKQQGNNSNHLSVAECHHKPVQFLTKRWWLLGALPNGLVPVRLGSLPVRGAVILGHTILGLSSKDASMSRQPDDDGPGSTATGGSLQATGSSSNVTEMTAITTPSVGPSSQEASGGGQSSNSASKKMDGTRNKRWSRFKDWVKK